MACLLVSEWGTPGVAHTQCPPSAQGPLVNGLYADEWYNSRPYTPGELGYVLHYLRLVGGARLRQVRVRSDSCTERRFLAEQACVSGIAYADCIAPRTYVWRTTPMPPPPQPRGPCVQQSAPPSHACSVLACA